jgi:hypothetical protein
LLLYCVLHRKPRTKLHRRQQRGPSPLQPPVAPCPPVPALDAPPPHPNPIDATWQGTQRAWDGHNMYCSRVGGTPGAIACGASFTHAHSHKAWRICLLFPQPSGAHRQRHYPQAKRHTAYLRRPGGGGPSKHQGLPCGALACCACSAPSRPLQPGREGQPAVREAASTARACPAHRVGIRTHLNC